MKKDLSNNSVINFIFLFISFIFSFVRSILLLFSSKNYKIRSNLFFDFLDFIFKIWPSYFWQKPNVYKIFSFPWDLLEYIFNKK